MAFGLVNGSHKAFALNCAFLASIPALFVLMILSILKGEEERTALFHELKVRGLTSKDIGEICERIYGRQCSKQQVSFLSNACREDINTWLLCPLSQRCLALYIEATYVAARRNKSLCQEAYYSILGLLP